MEETAFTLELAGDTLLAILASAAGAAVSGTGVVIVVGGPQYRVGSHRQFVLLARRLAAAGYPTLRFDYRGIGDSGGEARDFEHVNDDIRAAVDALIARAGVERVVLWGLCDGASAAMMYAPDDERVSGLVLLNPWVHSAQTEASARLKTYYLARLRSAEFWRKLVRFDLDWRDTLTSLWGYVRRMRPQRGGPDVAATRHFIDRMADGWRDSAARSLVILSGDDLTAAEFGELTRSSATWRALRARDGVRVAEVAAANHTFARADWRRAVEDLTLEWLHGA